MARVVEPLSGLAGGLVGLLTLAWLLFGPASHFVRSVTTCFSIPNGVSCASTGLDHITTGGIQIDLFPLSIALLGLVALLFVAVAVCAIVHSHNSAPLWQACLWACTGLLVIVVLLTLTNLALVLAPGLALAGAASGTAWVAERRRTALRRQGDLARSMETVGGVAAGGFGLAASVYLIAAPDQYMTQSSMCNAQGACHAVFSGSPSLLIADPVSSLLLGALALAVFGFFAYSAIQDSHSGAPVWRVWLWVAALLLLLFSFLGMLSIGLFFLPSAVLALFAAIGSVGWARGGAIAAMV